MDQVLPQDRAATNMRFVPGGTFLMGSSEHYPEEAPPHQAQIDPILVDVAPVTNAQFARFVAETGHVTLAEIAPDPADYPGLLPQFAQPASAVFIATSQAPISPHDLPWWHLVIGASWRHPQGPDGPRALLELADHPVVHVAHADAVAYATWAGKRLPTEAEWERAARGGLEGAAYSWGDAFTPGGEHYANTWQGTFPINDRGDDGYCGTSPVGSFPENGFGLFDMIGNVWELTSSAWTGPHTPMRSCCSVAREDSAALPRVMKGGSHLCAPNACQRYRPAARMPQHLDTTTSHVGFRCVADAPTAP